MQSIRRAVPAQDFGPLFTHKENCHVRILQTKRSPAGVG